MAGGTWTTDVLRFWFEETAPDQWFKKDDAFDQSVRAHFRQTHEHVASLSREDCSTDPDTALAAIIVLDQFSRNMFRGTTRAFASDPQALRIAETAIANGFDRQVSAGVRLFFYLPFEHAEAGEAQARSVALITALADPELVKWAEAHKAVIDRFGRFPHRNAILGRTSTLQELEFLQLPGSAF
ncbi:MAG: DUF924 family protein [Hyphomicrobiaceae bacterium]